MSGFLQILCHLWGDYILQNDWMALNKQKNTVKGYLALISHAVFYSAPFAVVAGLGLSPHFNIWGFLWIVVTHAIIDKFPLGMWVTRLKNWNWGNAGKVEGMIFGRPPYLIVWLMILIDNTIHLTLNAIGLWLTWKLAGGGL